MVLVILCVVCLERNAKVFEDHYSSLSWFGKIPFLYSLWASVPMEFEGIPLRIIMFDWVLVCFSKRYSSPEYLVLTPI